MDLGAPELLVVLAIAVLIFGGSRIADLGASLGKGIKEFKKEINADDSPKAPATASAAVTPTIAAPAAITTPVEVSEASSTDAFDATQRVCPHCGVANALSARFCSECGSALTNAPAAAETQQV